MDVQAPVHSIQNLITKIELIDGWLNSVGRNRHDRRGYQELHNDQGPLRGYHLSRTIAWI